MPENKRQHYVPQNYLKEFSSDGESIGVLLTDSGRCIDKPAPINSQAQESFFYGKDLELEKGLAELEGLLADNRKTIFENPTHKLNLYQKEVLYQDMMLQFSRTRYMANLYEEVATAQARRIWKHSNDEYARKHADDFGIRFNNPVVAPMAIILQILTVCFDLEFKVLVNRTEVPFLTSDNPVCRYNQYFEGYRRYHSGLNSKGEQLYYPLSPTFAVIYYDGNVYKAKFRKRNFLEITDVSDVNNLNGLVCAWANKCVYYHTGLMNAEHVSWTFEQVRNSRLGQHNEVEIPTSESSNVIVARYPFPALRMDLLFLKYLDKVKPY